MKTIDIDEMTRVIKEQIKSFNDDVELENIGHVISVGDGIATVYGLQHAIMGELLLFPFDIKGLVFNLEERQVGVILLSASNLIKEGDIVKTTKKVFEIPVGKALIGRIINPLGEPLDLKGSITCTDYYQIERPGKGIIERSQINEPLQTGIKAIDALIPIGKGQRQLIVGDRQTGKTSIAIDTILNQKGKNVICIYVAIGKKDSSVSAIASLLRSKGALDYTIIVNASASKGASIGYIAPFCGVTIAEYFLEKGLDVLIVYDDLTKHAINYRELSLLLKRPPGRQAYPGDIFYLHSRLLERAVKLKSGGSITALPIIETEAGDISAYIPTNVISITDGQIYLESDLFHQGIRPAINVSLSVSRVGGAAQWKAMKQVSGTFRINLANYRELESFLQFGSDLDIYAMKRLDRGRKTIEVLKQDLNEPLAMASQIVILYALANGHMDDLNIKQVINLETEIEQGLRINDKGKEIKKHLEENRVLPSDELLSSFINQLKRFI